MRSLIVWLVRHGPDTLKLFASITGLGTVAYWFWWQADVTAQISEANEERIEIRARQDNQKILFDRLKDSVHEQQLTCKDVQIDLATTRNYYRDCKMLGEK